MKKQKQIDWDFIWACIALAMIMGLLIIGVITGWFKA